MAGVLVGGALLSAFLQVAFDRLTSRQVVDFFRRRKLDEGMLNKLKLKLLSIDALADDAELKQLRDPRIRQWLFAVKDAVFDAEDLLAEIDYEITRCQVEAESESQTIIHKVSNLFNDPFSSFNSKIVSEMKQVLDKLEYLASQKGDLGLKGATHSSVGSGSKVPQKLASSSLVAESVIYGREDDKEIIFNWLTSECNNHNQLSILSIVGMGGLGKTTLVQHIYNDPRIDEAKFAIKAWVCVSDDFDVLTVTKAILEAITKKRDDSGSLEMVHGRLKEILTGKKFLLVLDDVWNENQEKWRAVRTPLLNCGACGSKILVTTRNENVASTMGSNEVHHLKQLQEDQCWKVFAKHAFRDDHFQLNVELKEIAIKIVEKCKGLPLALKSIGSLLHTKSSLSEWENVLISNIWDLPKEGDEIIPALFLSYHHLPSHLKRCFAFCALFPKDYEFKKNDLISLWVAENFLQCSQKSNIPEKVGEQYFHDLLSRSFFQQSSRFKTSFVMHDLLNDLAKYVCGETCFRLEDGKAEDVPKTTHHFSFNIFGVKGCDVIGSLSNAKRLRTFIPSPAMTQYWWGGMISIHELCSKLKFLHNLSLSQFRLLKEVPEILGELKYLCSLDLSGTGIKRLPDSTCSLYNLQILRLNACRSLEELPSNLPKLTKLRCLEFENTNVRRMPMHMEKMKRLQVLSKFFVGKSNELSIQQIKGLNLHGKLSIEELQNTVNPMDVLAADLKNKTRLVELGLVWNSNHIADDTRKDKEVLEYLQPSKYLKDLSICNYGGAQFPSWLSDNSFLNVISLKLEDCKYCLVLPPFGLLPFLKELTIRGLDGIVSIGAEFYGTSSSPFPSLETLSFYDMKEWEEWECKVSFPRLQFLRIRGCPNLRIGSCPKLESFPNEGLSAPRLVTFEIWSCPKVEMLSEGGLPSNLKQVTLRSMSMKLIGSLKGALGPNTCLDTLSISNADVECFPEEGLLPLSLTTLVISDCPNIKKLDYKGLCNLSSLQSLQLWECPNLECLPEEGLPKSISSLRIGICPLLKQRCQKPEGEDWGKIANIQNLNIW